MGGDPKHEPTSDGAQAIGDSVARALIPDRVRNLSQLRLAARLSEVVININDRDELDRLAVYLRERGLL